MERPSRLVRIVACIPYISCINKECSVKFPEQLGTVFHAEIQFQVSRLIDEINLSVLPDIAAWPQFADAPTPDTIGSSCKISFLVRNDRRVSVWQSNAKSSVYS